MDAYLFAVARFIVKGDSMPVKPALPLRDVQIKNDPAKATAFWPAGANAPYPALNKSVSVINSIFLRYR